MSDHDREHDDGGLTQAACIREAREFLRLSAAAHSFSSVPEEGDLSLLERLLGADGMREWTPHETNTVLEAVSYLRDAYGGKRRRLGPTALLHPLRTASLVGLAAGEPPPELVLVALLHDKTEDIRADSRGEQAWQELQQSFQSLIKRLSPDGEWYLGEKLEALTRRPHEPYTRYLGRIVEQAPLTPDLIRVKAADRLDNMQDLWIFRSGDPLEKMDFYGDVFRLLSLPNAPLRGGAAFDLGPFSISKRQYELFKALMLLSLVRAAPLPLDRTSRLLLDALALACLKESQRVLLVALALDFPDAASQRRILRETQDYGYLGGLASVRPKSPGGHQLDGLFIEHFDHGDATIRRERMAALEANTDLRARAAAAFVMVFEALLDDPAFYVRGIETAGLRPV